MRALPDRMRMIDPRRTEEALAVMERYIEYMYQRLNYVSDIMGRRLTAAMEAAETARQEAEALKEQLAALRTEAAQEGEEENGNPET